MPSVNVFFTPNDHYYASFGAYDANSSDRFGEYPYELALEGFYQWQLTPWAFIQPDFQYIVHPGGRYPDALVATLRLQVSF